MLSSAFVISFFFFFVRSFRGEEGAWELSGCPHVHPVLLWGPEEMSHGQQHTWAMVERWW